MKIRDIIMLKLLEDIIAYHDEQADAAEICNIPTLFMAIANYKETIEKIRFFLPSLKRTANND